MVWEDGRGTLPGVCYAQGMTSFLYAKGIRIFDYPEFAAPLRDRVRDCAQALAAKLSPSRLTRQIR